jgi:hypothetical protein
MAAVFLDIEKAFNTTWYSGLLYKLSELGFLTSHIKLIASFLTDRKFKVLVEDEFPMPWKQQQGCLKVLSSPHICNTPVALGTHLTLFKKDTCIYETEKHECRVLCKLQHNLTAVKSWCECWNTKMKEGKIQVIHFFQKT